VNFTKILCFGFADVTQNIDMRNSKNLRLQQSIEAVALNSQATPPLPTLVVATHRLGNTDLEFCFV